MRRGESITSSLQHLAFFPEKAKQNYPTVVALHGQGTDAHDLVPLVESLGFDDMLVIAPRAPRLFKLGGGYAWYDLSEEGIPDPSSFRESLRLLQEFLMQIRKGYPIDPTEIILLGFSQGAVMSYAAGLLNPIGVQGIVALSGYIPSRSNLSIQWNELKGFPVFISHGAYDELIPIKLGKESADLLRKAGATVTYREYAMGHQVTEDTLRDVISWMRGVLK
jgi:phospholipase/carboxylesterase